MTDHQLKVRHRTGYYAVDPASWRKAGDEKLISLSDLHALSNTGVLFYAHPIRPDKKGQDVTVELLIDPHTVSLENGSAYSTNLDFQIGAFTSDGELAHLESQTAKADELRPETYQQFLRSGIPARFQLALSLVTTFYTSRSGTIQTATSVVWRCRCRLRSEWSKNSAWGETISHG